MRRFSSAVVFAFLSAVPVSADVELPALISDGMVLQSDRPVPIWGRAAPGESVRVVLLDQFHTAVADDRGEWSVQLDALPVGGPHQLAVLGSNTIVVEDVWIGEVWLGSGQSNMRMTVAYSDGYEDAWKRADLPRIRMFREMSLPAEEPDWRGSGRWVVCAPDTFGDFSGTLFYFGRRLYDELDVPVGLIDSSVGGTPIESWTSRSAIDSCSALKDFVAAKNAAFEAFDVDAFLAMYKKRIALWREEVAQAEADGATPPRRPWNLAEYHLRVGDVAHLFNGKIAPLIPYGLRGIVWYQGENNVFDSELYSYQLPLLVEDWRSRWGRPDLPFAWVQLPNFGEGRRGASWAWVREAMRRSLSLPRTGMAITIDIGDSRDIHPRNKRDFGERLARWALGDVYGFDLATSGPLLAEYTFRGREVILAFEHVDDGLVARGGPLRTFEVQHEDRTWHAARASIDGAQVIVAADRVERPLAVRYAWASNPACNLFNGAGLPASPFTTEGLPREPE